MRIRNIFVAILIASATTAYAEGDDKGQSIMFKKSSGNDYEHLTTVPEKQSLGDRCMEMSRKIEGLKGKPQRRSAMMERYRQECGLR